MKKTNKKASVNFEIQLDQNNIPEKISWNATDGNNQINQAKAVMISIWDGKEKSSLKIDLWTKDMMAEEMKFFTFQILLKMNEVIKKSTGDEKLVFEMQKFIKKFGIMMEVLKK